MKYGILREHCKKQKEDRIKQLCRGKLPQFTAEAAGQTELCEERQSEKILENSF
ncbi:MAG: hypothetical protein ACLVG5_10375 [Clostridium sp.]